ncbi:fimbria/pilus periplasmic chaperone [bacterium]|nr:fimbria/pilus periplasmic chaperone [bacterium]
MSGASVAFASTIGVSPVRVTLSENQKMETITVRNDGTEPVIMQMELVSWSQEEGKDVYIATSEVLANPPIFTVPAGGSQLVRIGLRRAPNTQRELTYRIFMQELPPPLDNEFTGTRMLMRISMPVFFLPEDEAKPVLHWQASRTPQGALKISLTNNGNAHVQIINFKLSLPGSAQPWVTQQSAEYVLPNQSRDWMLPVNVENPIPPMGTTIRLFAQTDAGNFETEVIISP